MSSTDTEEEHDLHLNGNGNCAYSMEGQRSCCGRLTHFLKSNLFMVLNVVGIILGFVIGFWVRLYDPSADTVMWIGMPGEIYIRILKCIILPLIVCSVIDGTANTDPKTNGRIGLVALTYIISANSVCGILGLILSLIVQPGKDINEADSTRSVDTRNLKTMDIVADFIRNIFPPNMVGATLQVSQTQYKQVDGDVVTLNISGQLVNRTSQALVKSLGTANSTNILGLIVVCSALGIAASQAGKQAKPFVAFFKAGAHVIFKLFTWIKWTTPLGSTSLIAAALAKLDDLGPSLRSMGMLILVVTVIQVILLQVVLLSIVFVVVWRENPLIMFKRAARYYMIAFGAVNSTLPYPEYARVLKLYGVDPRVTEYVLPLSVTLNRCGSTFFITATCVFVAQYNGVTLTVGEIFVLGFLGILSSLAIPAVNSASVVSIVIILESMGLPTEGAIGLLMAVEWLNDRSRTCTNCLNHCIVVLTTWRLCRKEFRATMGKLTDNHNGTTEEKDIEKTSLC